MGFVLWLLDRRNRDRDKAGNLIAAPVVKPEQSCADESCGLNEVCPSDRLLQGELCEATYYDDEELDGFRGRCCDDYTDIELEQWRDVLYTLQASDLMGWERSIKRRGIVLPSAIRDELLMLLQEQSHHPSPTPLNVKN